MGPVVAQCAGLEEAELSSPESAAWTCGLSSGAATGLVSALPGIDSAELPQNATFAFSFFRAMEQPTGVRLWCSSHGNFSTYLSSCVHTPGTGIGTAKRQQLVVTQHSAGYIQQRCCAMI